MHRLFNLSTRRLLPTAFTAAAALTFSFSISAPQPLLLPRARAAAHDPREARRQVVVFSGGTGFNEVAKELRDAPRLHFTHVLPITDNGGSSREITRVLRGPGIGDLRSRLLRLAPDDKVYGHIKQVLEYRLPAGGDDDSEARAEWRRIVEGTHPYWTGVPQPVKATVRSFLVTFEHEVLRRSDSKRFDFRNGSVGNFFFSGARIFFCSLTAAIFCFAQVAGIPDTQQVVPVVDQNKRMTIVATLRDGTTVEGQNEISHPAQPTAANVIDKHGSAVVPLPSPIDQIHYVNNDWQPVEPRASAGALLALDSADHVCFALGSLYTSVIPCLNVKGVGQRIAAVPGRRVLILNGWPDRETHGMTAADMVDAVGRACQQYNPDAPDPPHSFVNTLVVPSHGSIPVDAVQLGNQGIDVITTPSDSSGRYDVVALKHTLERLFEEDP